MEGGNIVRRIGGESIKRAKQTLILEATHDDLTLYSAKRVEMIGEQGGVEYLNDYVPPLPLRIVKLDGPFDEKGQKVTVLEKEKWYAYKVIQFNRTPKNYEIKRIKWATQYDKGEINTKYPSVIGEKEVHFKIPEKVNVTRLRVFAYLEKPIDEVSVETSLIKEEVIIIVGTEQHSQSYGNKLMFPAQAVREIKKNYRKHKHTNILIFKDKFTAMQLSIIKRDAKKWNNTVYFKQIESVTDLINYINKGDATITRASLKIGKIIIFAHGLASIIDFGLEGENEASQKFKIEHVKKLNKESFTEHPVIYSYACRTGNSDTRKIVTYWKGYKYDSDTIKLVKPEESLAQKFADHLNAEVHAFLRRTDYTSSWLDGGDKLYTKDYITIEDEEVSNPLDPRDWIKKGWDEALWNSSGAYLAPTSGYTPAGLLEGGMFVFKKDKKPKKE